MPSPQARFWLQIREHGITRLIACNLVKLDNAAHCPRNCLPPGLDEALASIVDRDSHDLHSCATMWQPSQSKHIIIPLQIVEPYDATCP
jgi:hypothetical protein